MDGKFSIWVICHLQSTSCLILIYKSLWEKFGNKNPNFFQYDFNHPELIPEKYHNYFDFVLADPPFITFEVWQKYAEAIRKIIKKDENGNIQGRILLSTIQ